LIIPELDGITALDAGGIGSVDSAAAFGFTHIRISLVEWGQWDRWTPTLLGCEQRAPARQVRTIRKFAPVTFQGNRKLRSVRKTATFL
jgi:hypothetical protein